MVSRQSTARDNTEATVLNLQRMSTEDGPGIRTTVFLKGCSLECTWCHNPESVESATCVAWHESRCSGCIPRENTTGSNGDARPALTPCQDACLKGALTATGGTIHIDHALCSAGNGCNAACTDACPWAALELLGQRRSAADVFDEVVRDLAWYGCSGGGVTVSGGEPSLRPAFTSELLRLCRERGIHTAIDTCGQCTWQALERSTRHADLVLYDLKEIDSARHADFTGRSNHEILRNVLALAQRFREQQRRDSLWIRTPLVPGLTANEENLRGLGEFIAGKLGDVVTRWELLAFNNMAGDKYRRLGNRWELEGVETMAAGELENLQQVAHSCGLDGDKIVVTGPVKVPCDPGGKQTGARTPRPPAAR